MKTAPLFARQPILNAQKQVVGYELLFRDASDTEHAQFKDGDQATSEVIFHAFTDMNLDTATNGRRAFINVPPGFLGRMPEIEKDKVVLELQETVSFTPRVVDQVKALKEQGYLFALDEFNLREDNRKALKYVDIIRLDTNQLTEDQQTKYIKQLRPYHLKFLAEKVENQEQFDQCMELGFDFYQGYFFSKPQLVEGAAMASDATVVLQLLAELNDPDLDVESVYEIISRDSVLSYKLLKLINSSYFRRAKEIDSLHHGIVLLGIPQIRNWANLLALCELDSSNNAMKNLALVRARMCELLAERMGINNVFAAFTVGLFSCLEVFTNQPMDVLLKDLRLAAEVKSALLELSGIYGLLLKNTLAYERGDWNDLDWQELNAHGIQDEDFEQIYFDAIIIADSFDSQLS